MRSAAPQPREEPAPERADLDEKAATALDGLAGLASGARSLTARCPDPQTAMLLRRLVTEVVATGRHLEELRAEMARYAAANAGIDYAFEDGRAYERSLQVAPKVPRQGHRAPGGWHQPGIMRRIKVVAFIAVLGGGLRSLARAHRIAAALTAVTLPAAVGAGAYIALPHAGAPGGPSAGAATGPPGWSTSASPIASSPAAALAAAGPKARHAARRETLAGAGALVPAYVPVPQPSVTASASATPSASVSAQAGPAVLTVSTTALDLSSPLDPQATVTITATGGGWASWKVDKGGIDLDFSQDHGVLQSGQSAVITVSVDPAQAADGNLSQTFTVAGQQVTVSLPPLVAAAVPSPAASVVPSVLPGI